MLRPVVPKPAVGPSSACPGAKGEDATWQAEMPGPRSEDNSKGRDRVWAEECWPPAAVRTEAVSARALPCEVSGP